MNPNRNNTSATYPNAPEPWFTAKVTDVGGSSPVPYEFVEVWLDEAGAVVEMFGGRANDIASDPAYAVAGGPFAADDIVLVRSARGAAGLLWEALAVFGQLQTVEVVTDVACVDGDIVVTKMNLTGRDLVLSEP